MALRPTESECAECGAPVQTIGAPYCADCEAGRDDEDESDLPTVVAPGFGGFARANTEESLEAAAPRPRIPTPAHPGDRGNRDTLDTRTPDEAPLWASPLTWILVAALGAVLGAAGLLAG